MKKLTKAKSKPYRREGFAILNPYGDVWTPEIFSSEEDAMAHVREFWRGTGQDTEKFKVVPGRLVISVTPAGRAALTSDQEGNDET